MNPIGTVLFRKEGSDEWMQCDGRALSRAEYPALWKTMGPYFGEDGTQTTFNLPDFRPFSTPEHPLYIRVK